MTADFDFDDAPIDDAEEIDFDEEQVDEVPAEKRSPLRMILLVLVILVLLCVVCFLIGRFIPGLPGIPGFPGEPTVAPTAEPTTEPTVILTVEPTTEPTVILTVEPTTEPTTEPTGEPTMEPTSEPTGEPTGEPTSEPTGEPTMEPTSEPTGEPTVEPTSEPNCDANIPPAADAGGPYDAMMGKGQAVVNFDGSNSTDPDGTVEDYEWDFGDNSESGNGESVSHAYTGTGNFEAKLTVTDNCGATGEDTAEVTIVGPTPPANGTTTPTPPPTSEPAPEGATLGFCHLVQYGQTLSGIAAYYGVPLPILADVNGVSMQYFVIAGQGLFIPVSEVEYGPNVYEVQPGDTLGSVAYECGLSSGILATVNNLAPNASLAPGQILMIPPWRQVYP